jgi:hypothetical protein
VILAVCCYPLPLTSLFRLRPVAVVNAGALLTFSVPNTTRSLLNLAPEASGTKHSSPPSFYDKHLRESLILKILPSVQQAIAGVVDRTLSSIQQSNIALPSTSGMVGGVVTETGRHYLDDVKNQPMRNERSVAKFYSRTTADYCVAVASTLALHPSTDRWYSLLEWDDERSESGYALAEGALRILPSMRLVLLGERLPLHYEKKIMEAFSKDRVDPWLRWRRDFQIS